jgi:tetratricopeptide (TPR) repeat protein
MEPEEPVFLRVAELLELSRPRPRVPRMWFLLGGFIFVIMISTTVGNRSPAMHKAVEVFSALVMLGLVAALSGATLVMVRKLRGEQQQVEAAAELVQLRRWPEAAMMLEHYLSSPSRTLQLRSQALIYLSAVLARYHRFDDAIKVQDHLLDNDLVDPGTAHGLRLGRTMAMLREDHLFDADRAISELRRSVPAGVDSGGLALVEIYRDVKTGHPTEAIELFEKKLPALRDQLGHRVADAYALVARAYDLLNQPEQAQQAWENATVLSPPAELFRRYPEVEKLKDRYSPAPAPPEAA